MTEPTNAPPAGWYDDGSGRRRYWDGSSWGQYEDAQSPTAQVAQATATQERPPTPVVGLIAFITAIVGFVFACIPGALIIGWVLLPIAFVLSIVGLFLKGKKWPSITGLIVSIVGTIVGFVVFFAVVAVSFDEAFGDGETTVIEPDVEVELEDPDSGSADAGESASDAGSRDDPVAIGSLIIGDEFEVTVNAIDLDATDEVLAANQFNDDPDAGDAYAIVNVTITYTGEESNYAATVGIDYVTSTGEVRDSWESFVVAPEPEIGLDELYTGGSVTGNIVVAVPAGDEGLIRVRPGLFEDEVFVSP